MLGQNLDIPTLEDIIQARDRTRKYIDLGTKIVSQEVLNNKYGFPIFIKPEGLQPTGSFKIRGALNKILKVYEEQSTEHFITASAGNHAIGLSFSARLMGVQSTVVVPEMTPQIKIDTCRDMGANVILVGRNYDEAYKEAQIISEKKQYYYIHPVADCEVVAGQGTIGLEIIEELPDIEQIVVPIGGGGLISGIALAVKSLKPNVKIIGIQPEGSKSYYESWKSGRLTSIKSSITIAEGLSLKKPEAYLFELMKQYVDEITYVKELTIKEAIKDFLFLGKLVTEGSAAVSLASIIEGQIDKDKKTVLIASGSNIDKDTLIQIMR